MRTLLIAIVLMLSNAATAQVAVVHINAEFNKSNDWYGMKALDGTKLFQGYIEQNPAIKEKYKITRVPTLILYRDGEEINRWEAGLDMKLHVTTKEIQQEIDKL